MLTIRERRRYQQGAPRGQRCGWSEYQVVDGRKVVERFEILANARKKYPQAIWTRNSGIDGHLWDQMTLRLQERGALSR